jgi:hypothetical protein
MANDKKVCKTCVAEKDIDDFWKQPTSRDGRYSDCKECAYKKQKENLKKRLAENPHYTHERQKAWRERTGKGNIRNNARKHLEQKYGISVEDYESMLLAQDGCCGICRVKFGEGFRPIVDHDHESGKVRSLVHYGCNTAIGLFRDSPELCRIAAEYLERHGRV